MKSKSAPSAVAQQLEYCLPAFVMKFSEPGRYVQFHLSRHENPADVWLVDPTGVREWVDREGGRDAIDAKERERLLARIVAEARGLNLWLGVVGQALPPRPKHLPPAPPTRALPALRAADAEDCRDGEDVALAAEAERAARPEADEMALTDDPEINALSEFEANARRVPVANLTLSAAGRAALEGEIAAALAEFRPMAERGLGFADSMVRQLEWCRAAVARETTGPAPGPFSMADVAFRELSMHGDRPDLAGRIVRIQDAMLAAMH